MVTQTADQQNPYQTLPERAFWRTGVVEQDFPKIDNVYVKKFDINPDDTIISAGSCFSQHISKRLATSGFNYRDFEPVPALLPKSLRNEYGYELFSARYGNIYTVVQLKQLFDRAFGYFEPTERYWEEGGRYFDPFRPTVEPAGFASLDEFDAMQDYHFACVRQMFSEFDVMIFTMGLTEAWTNKEDGAVYPMCPGTAAGTFDDSKYVLKNFSFLEIYEAFTDLVANIRKINPDVKFIVTVSPVPLTATASASHALVANTYTKSTLRSVAGELAANDPLIDYFPSYEMVATHAMKGIYYDDNQRTITTAGVDCVMEMFFAEHRPLAAAARQTLGEEPAPVDDDPWCDEEMLETELVR